MQVLHENLSEQEFSWLPHLEVIFHDDIFIFCLFPVMCEKYLRFHKRGKELITKERGYQAPKALTPEVQQHSFDGASRFQEKNSALPSLTFQMSSNNGNETD